MSCHAAKSDRDVSGELVLARKRQYTLQFCWTLFPSRLLSSFAALLSHTGIWFVINISQMMREDIREIERTRSKQLYLKSDAVEEGG
jgi:hypothetical protein